MLTRIRNAITARKAKVIMPASKLKQRIAEVLKDEGFVGVVSFEEDGKQGLLSIELRYDNNNRNAIQGIRRVSKPGQRTYARHDRAAQACARGLGIAILTTSKGVMTEREARKQGLGGELLCEVW